MGNDVIRKILIVGGGIGGMALSILLARQGREVTLVEIDPEWRAIGAGLTLNGATLRALGHLGLEDAVRAHGHIHGGVRVHDRDGTVIFDAPGFVPAVGDITAGGAILRPVLHAILADSVRTSGVDVRLGTTIETLDQDGDGVAVTFRDGGSARYDLVVGADGITSQVRKMIMPQAPALRFTGQGAWRAVFPRPSEVDKPWIFFGDHKKAGFNPVSDTEMYLFLLEPAPDNPWRDVQSQPQHLAGLMSRYGGLMGELAGRFDDTTRINYRPLETMVLPKPWHVGRVALLGDACHSTPPHAGYGAGLSMEDAIVMAEQIAADGAIEDRLTRYGDRRYDRCRKMVDASVALGELEVAGAPLIQQQQAGMALFEMAYPDF